MRRAAIGRQQLINMLICLYSRQLLTRNYPSSVSLRPICTLAHSLVWVHSFKYSYKMFTSKDISGVHKYAENHYDERDCRFSIYFYKILIYF